MKKGREFSVHKNGSHEARPNMFPNGHSVTGEQDYLSPLVAVWQAWKLRGEMILQDGVRYHGLSMQHCCVNSNILPILKSAVCISQEPHYVRPSFKSVHFDDCIETAMPADSDSRLYSTFVSHDALRCWPDKPWRYRRKSPSRRFSWRKLTNLVYPFCSFENDPVSPEGDPRREIAFQAESGCKSTGPSTDCLLPDDGRNLRFHENTLHLQFEKDPGSGGQVLTDITNIISPNHQRKGDGAPLSGLAVSSSHLGSTHQNDRKLPPRQKIMHAHEVTEVENNDFFSAVQIGQLDPVSLKNAPIDAQQAFQLQAFQEGNALHDDFPDDINGAGHEESDGYSPGGSSMHSDDPPMSHENARQEVILFHFDEQPIRTFVSWNSYEEMVTEIAHHYGLRRQQVEDVYEVAVAPPDIGNEIVPTVVHVFGDILPTSTERLVLIDIEYHAHRIERNFRSGPDVFRSVKPIPQTASRNDVLFKANVDRYCRREDGRCLVFINARRWPDYDLDRKVIAHGDYIRIAVPPSERFTCPTVDVSRMTQQGLSDQQILDEIHNDDAASGFSPSLLGQEDVQALATPHLDIDDELLLMQFSQGYGNSANVQETGFPSNSSSIGSEEPDWSVDLLRYARAHYHTCDPVQQEDFIFSIYTWFLDHDSHHLCREPKIAVLGDDPAEWREEILVPWQNHLRADDTVLIDLVQPFVPRARVEEHIAHVILTQRPQNLQSVLFSMEFVDEVQSSVFVSFAVAVPKTCTGRTIADLVPLYDAFYLNRQDWVLPVLMSSDSEFSARFGQGLHVRIFPEETDGYGELSDASNLLQSSGRTVSAKDAARAVALSVQNGANTECVSEFKRCRPSFDSFSLTDEFIRYVQAVGSQEIPDDIPPFQPEGMSQQPAWVQDLWEKWVETLAQNGGDQQSGLRIETWFTNPRRWTRCAQSRIVVLSSNFHQWERELLSAWHDRAALSLPTQFAIVFPTPQDVDRTVQEQLIIEQESESFSRSIVVTVCDTHRSSGRHGSIALVVSDRLELQSLVTLLGYAAICPPERDENECLLWMGNIAIRPEQTLHVRTGNALRFLVRRGIRVSIQELLSLSDQQLRNELRAAIGGAIFRRPNVPGFPADPHSANNPVANQSSSRQQAVDYPPDWLNQLQDAFNQHAFIEQTEEGPVIYVLVWFVHGVRLRSNEQPKVVRLDSDHQWWRSEIIFPWRDQFERALPITLNFVDPVPPKEPWQSHAAHIIVSQAVPEDHVAVLLTPVSQIEQGHPLSQSAQVVHQFSAVGDFLDRFGLTNVSPDTVIVRRGRLVFPSDHTVRVGSGDGIETEFPPTMRSQREGVDGSADLPAYAVGPATGRENTDDAITCSEDAQDLDEFDDASLMQGLGTYGAASEPSHSNFPDGGDPHCAIEVDSQVQREEEFFQFNPQAEEFRPQAYVLPEWAQVIEDIYYIWDVHAFAWQGESRATHFMTWYLAPGIGRQQCLYGRKIALFADFWNRREQFRRKWIDEFDAGADFQVVLVSPPPTQMESGIAGHIILIQHNDPVWSSILLSSFDPAINNGHPFHVALTFPEQLQFQDVLIRVGYVQECAYHAQCLFRLRSQTFAAHDQVRASDGDAVDLLVNRHFLPANWNPPFIPHAPGAEGLELLQTKVSLRKTDRRQNPSSQIQNEPNKSVFISLQSSIHTEAQDIEGISFTLAVFLNQPQVRESDLVVCTWELNSGQNLFDLHKCSGFNAVEVCQTFQTKHGLIKQCSELYQVRFTRPSWAFESYRWYVGSFVQVQSNHALVACVAYRKGGAAAKVLTMQKVIRANLLRDNLNAVHGTLIRVNGHIAGDTIRFHNGDVLEFHEAEIGRSFSLSRCSPKVQICLDAAVTGHISGFEDDRDAFELLQYPAIRETLIHEDGWVFQCIPEGADLHKATFEALFAQSKLQDESVLAYELYVDGATKGDLSGWAVVAVAVTRSGRIFKGCIGGMTEIDRGSPSWIGANAHSNIDAELSAMAVATAFAYFGSDEQPLVVRPDLALSKRFLEVESTSRQDSVIAKVVHVLGQSKPNNVSVVEVRAHRGDPWNELADAIARHVVSNRTVVGKVPWPPLNTLATSPSIQKWEWLRVQSSSYSRTLPVLHGSAVWQPTLSHKRISINVERDESRYSEMMISFTVATYNGLALNDEDQSSTISGSGSVRLDYQLHKHKIAVVGIQEARTQAGSRCTDHYKIFSSGYQQCGRSRHFGCELWVHKTLPLGKRSDGQLIRLADCKVTITFSESRLLVARFEGSVDLCVVVAHAPCVSADRHIEEVRQWWTSLTDKIGVGLHSNTVVLIDANAPLADRETQFFGMHHAERSNQQGLEFQDFLTSNEFFAPSTFPTHSGSSATWQHPRGDKLRRDFVLLSRSLHALCTGSRVCEDFDGGFGHIDHCPALCTIEGIMLVRPQAKKLKWDFRKMQDPEAQKAFAESLATLPLPSWEVSVDDHSVLLENNILQLASQHFGTYRRERLRPVLSEATLAGIQLKRQVLDMARKQNFRDASIVDELKYLEKAVRGLVAADQKKWYADWLDSINDESQRHDTAQVYKRLQRLGRRKKDLSTGPRPLPKLKVSEGQFAQSFDECQNVWKKQFAVIEAGIDVLDMQLAQLHNTSSVGFLREVDNCPDPWQVLALIRRFKNGKAPGPGQLPVDIIKSGGIAMAKALTPLLVKATWHIKEPLSWKGGLLVPLFKGKGSPAEPSQYRSIFLSDVCAKLHHAQVRKHLADTWNADERLIQMGGKKGCSTDVAHHLLHAHLA